MNDNAADIDVTGWTLSGGGIERVTFRDTIPNGSGQRFIRARALKP